MVELCPGLMHTISSSSLLLGVSGIVLHLDIHLSVRCVGGWILGGHYEMQSGDLLCNDKLWAERELNVMIWIIPTCNYPCQFQLSCLLFAVLKYWSTPLRRGFNITIKIKFEIFKYGSPSIFMPKNEYRTYTWVFTDLNQAGNICQERSKENRYHFLGPSRCLSLECFKRIYLWLALSVGISADNQTWRNSGMHIQIQFNLSVGFGWHSSWCSPQYSDIVL